MLTMTQKVNGSSILGWLNMMLGLLRQNVNALSDYYKNLIGIALEVLEYMKTVRCVRLSG
jgi:hypothetical protein